MAADIAYTSTTTGTSSSRTRSRILTVRTVRAYRWPEVALFALLFVIFVCAAMTIGIYSYFSYVQQRLTIGSPW
jgi:Mg/Co/Ni transporter MgtE